MYCVYRMYISGTITDDRSKCKVQDATERLVDYGVQKCGGNVSDG